MAAPEIRLNIFELVSSLAKTLDMMSPVIADHHLRVAYISFRIAQELNWPSDERRELVLAGALHDIGAFSLTERLNLLDFEYAQPGKHSMAGYLLLKRFPPFEGMADLVRFHHLPWGNGTGIMRKGVTVPRGSHALNLADRIAILLSRDRPTLAQVNDIREAITRLKGQVFEPDMVEAFLRLASKDYFWLEILSDRVEYTIGKAAGFQLKEMTLTDLIEFSKLMCQVIDFKSEFTATHSSGVAAVSMALARFMGFSDIECQMINVSANLHDLGKLAIPSEILEKAGKLDDDERNVMRTHVYFTHQILDPIEALSVIKSWAALHQERLNGTGYPFRYTREELPLVSRLVAVADVFVAITENRPYRNGMGKDRAIGLLKKMTEEKELEPLVVKVLLEHFDSINDTRIAAQEKAISEYEEFILAMEEE
ncbi:MAG TPA: HD domain-containing protein [Candidatus Hydrogenedentes bacterium]|nr:HD domain-containing protein [Candidatus Hydrogenedentota bacterium]